MDRVRLECNPITYGSEIDAKKHFQMICKDFINYFDARKIIENMSWVEKMWFWFNWVKENPKNHYPLLTHKLVFINSLGWIMKFKCEKSDASTIGTQWINSSVSLKHTLNNDVYDMLLENSQWNQIFYQLLVCRIVTTLANRNFSI